MCKVLAAIRIGVCGSLYNVNLTADVVASAFILSWYVVGALIKNQPSFAVVVDWSTAARRLVSFGPLVFEKHALHNLVNSEGGGSRNLVGSPSPSGEEHRTCWLRRAVPPSGEGCQT